MGGTGVSCLDSWFVLFIYSLIFFWIRFFSSLKEFFLIDINAYKKIYIFIYFNNLKIKNNRLKFKKNNIVIKNQNKYMDIKF